MTVHEDLAEGIWDDILEEPEEAAAVFRVQKMHTSGALNDDETGSAYADSLGSSARFRPARWPIHQTAAFAYLHALVGSGDVAFTPIRTGGAPGPDSDREGNAAKLRRTCPPFMAEVDLTQNGADCDGGLTWQQTIHLPRATGAFYYEDNCPRQLQSRLDFKATYRPSWAPLEIGDSWPSRTLMHLWQYSAVARWPYGSEYILLFINYSWGDRAKALAKW